MKYLCIICAEKMMEQLAPADAAQHYEEYREFTDGVRRSGQLVDCNRLMPPDTATTVRVRNGKVSTTDGPFAETREHLRRLLPDQRRATCRRRSRSRPGFPGPSVDASK